MAKPNLRLVLPRSVNGTVPPRRKPNAELRTREYLTEAEVERLMKVKDNRHGQRDATMILIAYRHGLRAAEVVDLRWDQVDLGRNAALQSSAAHRPHTSSTVTKWGRCGHCPARVRLCSPANAARRLRRLVSAR
jgi:integrase